MQVSHIDFSQVANQVTSYVTSEWKNSRVSTVALGFTALPAVEMALHAVSDLGKKFSGKYKEKELDTINWNLSANLGGAIFYGFCALNPIPGSRRIAALMFTGYSLFFANHHAEGERTSYLTSRVIYHPSVQVLEHIILPLFEHVVEPIFERIWKVVSAILSHISLPKHPIWYVIAALATATFLYHQSGGKVNLPFLQPKTP